MKRYLSSIIAVIIAVSLVAFTRPEIKVKPLATKIFQYNAPALNPFSQANVTNDNNWSVTSLTQTTCSEDNQKACQLLVDDSFINPDNTLKSTFAIDATMFTTGIYYVSGGSASAIYNKLNN